MKTKFLVLLLLLSGITGNAQPDFSALWKEAAALDEQSLPQSALEVVDRIYSAALKEGNSPELIKSLIYKLKYETAIDRDKFPDILCEVEKFAQEDRNRTEQAVLHLLLAELYANYYQANAYGINQKTALPLPESALPPCENLEEKSANFFIRKTLDYIALSLNSAKELQKTDILDYEKILTTGESSRNLRPTLYDFLIHRGIELLSRFAQDTRTEEYFPQTSLPGQENFAPAEDFVRLSSTAAGYNMAPQILKYYREWLDFRLRENNPEALLAADLERLDFVLEHTQTDQAGDNYLEALQKLKKRYEKNDCCVEILDREASFYFNTFDYVAPDKDEASKERANQKKIYEICTEGIQKYPGYERIGLLQKRLSQITQGYMEIKSNNAVYPGKELELTVQYRNFNELTVAIYKIKAPVSVYTVEWTKEGQYKTSGAPVQVQKIALVNEYPYIRSDTTLKIRMNDPGNYEYVLYADSLKTNPANRQFSVSRLAAVSRSLDKQREFLVVDRLSGEPVEGAQIQFYKRKNNALEPLGGETALTTGKYGLAQMDNSIDASFYHTFLGNDTALALSPAPWISSYREPDKNLRTLVLLTDRSIYRPGQTVHFKGIAYETGENRQQVVPGLKCTLTLKDANYKTITEKTLDTNEWGSFAGEFVIPQGLLNGNFTILSDKNGVGVSFRVEEYKRPAFDIQFSPNDGAYRFGDEIKVKGNVKTFSGVAMQDVTVRYRITRQNHGWFSRYWRAPVQTGEGNVRTNGDGSFEIAFLSGKVFEDRNRKDVSYTYTVEATVTGTNGETQNSRTSVHIGDRPVYLTVNELTGIVDKGRLPAVRVTAVNLSGNPVEVQGNYEIYSLKADKKDLPDSETAVWTPDKPVASGRFETGKELDISVLKSLKTGKYRWKETGDGGTEVDFILASAQDKRPPVPVYEWLMETKTACAAGENAEIIYGSSEKNVHVLYEIFRNKKKLAASRFILNNENRKIEIPFLETYGDGITACFTFVKNNRIFTKDVNIYRKQPDNELKLKMEVFRDKLLPGQKEEWKISVKDAGEKGVSSELLAGMYDASLDKILPHAWNVNFIPGVYLYAPRWEEGTEFNTSGRSIESQTDYPAVPAYRFDTFNWFGWSFRNQVALTGRIMRKATFFTGAVEGIRAGVDIADLAEPMAQQVEFAKNSISAQEKISLKQQEETPVQIRQNFDETAFFYPQLKTDENGETLISFTVPESNTAWKFMGLAHTKGLKYGKIIEEAVSRKQLMVAPNMPRFIREGDRVTITADISNLSENPLSGTVTIESLDPNTLRPHIRIAENSTDFHLEAGKTSAVSWMFDVPPGTGLTALKIVARSAGFSDGEQHLLPVLPNRMLVTESLPMDISGGQTKTFSFDKMEKNVSPTLENHRLTLEFTANPIWYAVQALPGLAAPQSENALSWFAAYYSNALSVSIANSYPEIKSFIEIRMKENGTEETLLSHLEKNQDLKAVLLEETPWVLQAGNETERKQQLISLFDANRAAYLNAQAIEKLRSLQTDEGGWAWFKGMGDNVSITQWMLYGMGRLEEAGAVDESGELREMQEKAVHFIDRRFKKYHSSKSLKDLNAQASPSTYELEYLLVRSFYREIPFGEAEEAARFYTSLAGKHWAKADGLYDRAIIASILQRNGDQKTALSIIKSLREHASRKPDMGMFWANNTIHSFLSQSAVCVHTFIMEAFRETGAAEKEMDEMKRWLLKQKQTQEWESVPATVNAIGVLLQTGTKWLENEGKASIRLGDKAPLSTGQGETGTGYIKEVYPAGEITAGMSRVEVTKEGAGPGWGALYWQYFEDLDKITSSKSGPEVEKELFIEKITATGKALDAITEGRPIRVGDKVIVRLTVRSGRDMEYVHLKDMRASCFEPVESLSGTRWAQGLTYYQSIRDASVNFYFQQLPKGTYVFEYPLYATSKGDYSNGITSIQCLYAPEFVSHTSGGRVKVK
ncbi:MAG: hypothetical protein LBI65_04285 [Candidatus Symbiothrix sp.]|jgi:hypothetical protein|nr:hypothetical protein [Candidatus Symbiothrix sp.]